MFHIPAFSKSINKFLNLKKDGVYIDCTFGCGGHSKIILSYLNHNGRLYAFDVDPESFNLGSKFKDNRFEIINSNFVTIKNYMSKKLLFGKIDGILFDLGLSSHQLDNPSRGFSFKRNGPLDMRMNQNIGISAKSWINKANEFDIYNVLKYFGEEKFSKKIAKKIVNYRKKNYISTTFDLSRLVESVIKTKRYYKNKSTRTFQAIRIYINNELFFLKKALDLSFSLLASKGRLVVISFHSLEDRIVKNFINNKSNINYFLLPDLPLTLNQIKNLYSTKMINLGKFKPSLIEIQNNNRIRSAVLRVAEKK